MLNIDMAAYIGLISLLVFFIAGNVFLLNESKKRENGISEVKKLRWIAIINIIFLGITFFFPPIFGSNQLTTLYNNLPPIFLIYVPFLITYGIIMSIFGRSVKERWGNYLKRAGLIGIVGNSFLFPFPIIYLIGLYDDIIITIMLILFYIGGFLGLIEYILFYVNGKKNKIKNFEISGILLSLGYVVGFILVITLRIVFPFQFI